MALNGNQAEFVESYRECLNVHKAAELSGIELDRQSSKKYYVYFLADPTDRIFYIGKGSGRRATYHFRYYESKPENVNPFVRSKISEIVNSGDGPKEIYFDHFDREHKALQLERRLIKSLRDTGLANISSGNRTNQESALARLKHDFDRIIPYEAWFKGLSSQELVNCWIFHRGPYDTYHSLVDLHKELIVEMEGAL